MKKSHNSHNNGWILSWIDLHLYFMIIYTCVLNINPVFKIWIYESNTLMFSKRYQQKLFFKVEQRAVIPKIIGGFYPKLKPASVAQLDAPSDWRPGGRGFNPAEVGNILSWRLIMKYFLRSFSPFRWFKKDSCQFLAKECAQYWLTA